MTVLEAQPAPIEVVEEQPRVTDTAVLKKDRLRFGFGSVLYQSEEVGLGSAGIPTLIVRGLGGDDLHLGIYGAAGSMASLVQWVGTLLLRKFNSNRQAMNCSMLVGLVTAGLIAASIMAFPLLMSMSVAVFLRTGAAGSWLSGLLGGLSLWAFLLLALAFTGVSGVQTNIEASWIGDLVPTKRLAWFTSVKWALGVISILLFSFVFAFMCQFWPNLFAYAFVYVVFAASFLIAIMLYRRTTDRVPQNVSFVGSDRQARLNYTSAPLWCYILFSGLWGTGRQAQFAFASAYLMDQFHFSLAQISSVLASQYVVSAIVMLLLGKVADKSGHRFWLIVLSAAVPTCMFLWVSSAWWGITPIIVYYFLNGFAGHTSSMLGTNYALEIFPAKGRSGYFAFAKLVTGVIGVATTVGAGAFLRSMRGTVKFDLWGATLNHYHVFFAISAAVALSSVIPLIIAGKRTVSEPKVS